MKSFLNTLKGKETEQELIAYKEKLLKNEDNVKRIDLTVDAFMDINFVQTLLKIFSGIKIKFLVDSTLDPNRQNCIFREDEIEYLKRSNKLLKENNISVEMFDAFMYESFEMDKVIEANEILYKTVNNIKNQTIDGEKLSPYEQFLRAYIAVSKMEYQKEDIETERQSKSRHLINAMTGDKKVCVSFAARLTFICNKLGIPCINQIVTGHQVCLVYMQDEKYGINGMYISDPTTKKNIYTLVSPHMYLSLKGITSGKNYDYKIHHNRNTVNQEFANFYANIPASAQEEMKDYYQYRKDLEFNNTEIENQQNMAPSDYLEYDMVSTLEDIIFACATGNKDAFSMILENKDKITKYWSFTDMELFYEYILNQLEILREEVKQENNDKDLTEGDIDIIITVNLCDQLDGTRLNLVYDRNKDNELEKIKSKPIHVTDTICAIATIFRAQKNGEISKEEAWNIAVEYLELASYSNVDNLIEKTENLYMETKDETYKDILEFLKDWEYALSNEKGVEI